MHVLQAEADQLNNSLRSGKLGIWDRLGVSNARKVRRHYEMMRKSRRRYISNTKKT